MGVGGFTWNLTLNVINNIISKPLFLKYFLQRKNKKQQKTWLRKPWYFPKFHKKKVFLIFLSPAGSYLTPNPTSSSSTFSLTVILISPIPISWIQGDQLEMAVCFWFLEKLDLSSIHYCTVEYTSVKRYKNNTAMFI